MSTSFKRQLPIAPSFKQENDNDCHNAYLFVPTVCDLTPILHRDPCSTLTRHRMLFANLRCEYRCRDTAHDLQVVGIVACLEVYIHSHRAQSFHSTRLFVYLFRQH